MTRPLRIEYSNAWYHAMNRGRSRKNIFYTNDDRHTFLFLLKELFERFHVQIHAYCLMDNHYHLLVNTPFPNLQRAMRHLGGIYTQRFNRAHGKDGSLFRGRYKSKLIESESYLTRLSRYIHLNPVNAKMTYLPEEYMWSSYRAFLQQEMKPKWLFCQDTLAYFGEKNDMARLQAYQDYINEGVDADLFNKMTSDKSPAILGSDDFIKSMAQKIKYIDTLEIPDQTPVIKFVQPSLSRIQEVVAEHYHISTEDIKKPKQQLGNLPRQTAIYMSGNHTNYSHQVIANFFGNTSRYGVARSCHRLKRERALNLGLSNFLSEMEEALQINNPFSEKD